MIIAYGLDDAWFQSLAAILRDGQDYVIQRGSYAGQRRKELDLFVLRVIHPALQLVPIVPDSVPPPTSLRGATVYCTNQPCHLCAMLLINAGVVRVVYSHPYPDEAAVTLLAQVGVILEVKRET